MDDQENTYSALDPNASKPHVLHNHTRMAFGFMDRLKVLIGMKVLLKIDIEVSKDVRVLRTTCNTEFEPLINKKHD